MISNINKFVIKLSHGTQTFSDILFIENKSNKKQKLFFYFWDYLKNMRSVSPEAMLEPKNIDSPLCT